MKEEMSIIRAKRKRNNFTIIDNTGLIDPGLTWKETGLLAFLMTKPDDWEISIKALTTNKQDKRDSVSTALNGLQQKGYVHRVDYRHKGKFQTEYLVFETKEDLTDWLKEENLLESADRNGKTVTAKPRRQNRNGRTVTEKPHQVINKEIITEKQITEKQITEGDAPLRSANESALEQTEISSPQTPEPPQIQENLVLSQHILSPQDALNRIDSVCQPPQRLSITKKLTQEETSSAPGAPAQKETTGQRVSRIYQETGILPRTPLEIEAWIQEDLGSEIIALYRESGRVTTTKRGDINPDFAAYLTNEYNQRSQEKKDIDYGYNYIKSMEWGEKRNWETLAALVLKWQAAKQTGDRDINLTHSLETHRQRENTLEHLRREDDWINP